MSKTEQRRKNTKATGGKSGPAANEEPKKKSFLDDMTEEEFKKAIAETVREVLAEEKKKSEGGTDPTPVGKTGGDDGKNKGPEDNPTKSSTEGMKVQRVAKALVKGENGNEIKYFLLLCAAKQASIDGGYDIVWVYMKDNKVVRELTDKELADLCGC